MNSQEWTLSRNVPEIRLGIVGSLSSGKSALVHRYLTGSYMQVTSGQIFPQGAGSLNIFYFQEESPEGGRFKKEVVVDGQSFLLLIRDEGGPPELQVTHHQSGLRSKKKICVIFGTFLGFPCLVLIFLSMFQFTAWVDAVIFVFRKDSFQTNLIIDNMMDHRLQIAFSLLFS